MTIAYLVQRIFQLLLIVVIAVTINFILPRLIPGDPVETALATKIAVSGNVSVDVQKVAEAYRAKFGLDQPLWKQYLNYWQDILRLDFGVSLVDFPEPVINQIRSALPWTVGLLTMATLISFVLGSILGALLAWPRTPAIFQPLVSPLLLLSTIPYFLLGIILLWLFAVEWRLFPAGGGFSPTRIPGRDLGTVLDILYHSILPALSLVLGAVGAWAIGMRAMMISVLGEDYVTFAEAKGLPARRIFLWYGMRNALLPQVTQLALALGGVIGGAVLVEAMFSYPGIGTLLFSAIAGKDYFVIQGIVLMLILSLAGALFIIDLIYPLLDPRIRYHR
ncbi:MAG TPA: ABC transporter permease [Caldilineaceae bacterium]|nr:ABC transporter permease [Caldilineaceae bacterium]